MALSITIEVERISNLVRGFGWEKKKEEVIGDKIVVTFEKKMESKPVGTPT